MELAWWLFESFGLFMKLPRLCFFLHMGFTEILGFLVVGVLLDDIMRKKGYAMMMNEEDECLNRG